MLPVPAMRVLLGWILAVFLSLTATITVAELSYRSYVFDFYAPELRAYNPAETRTKPGSADILVMGDSFSAGQQSYVAELRALVSECTIVNGAIPGSGIHEANVLAPSLFDRYDPAVLVYQIYVGSDLINIRYPKNWSELSWFRNVFWLLADHFKLLLYLNYRLGQVRRSWRDAEGNRSEETQADSFSPEDYPPYMKNYLKADSRIIERQIALDAERSADFEVLIGGLRELLANCGDGRCIPFLLVIPHSVEVGEIYFEDMTQLGPSLSRRSRPCMRRAIRLSPSSRMSLTRIHRSKVVNVLKPLQEAHRAGARMYFRNGPHLAPAGQQVVAKKLAEELRRANPNCLAERPGDAADAYSLEWRRN